MELKTEGREVWLDPLGREALLVPMGGWNSLLLGGDEDPWHPDEPGQREPFLYRLVKADNDRLWLNWMVHPYEPWSPYEAISDELHRAGWSRRDEPEMEVCEHGMNAAHCGGPMHWYD